MIEIAHIGRSRNERGKEKLKQFYQKLLAVTRTRRGTSATLRRRDRSRDETR
jgi:hypothetical protein